MFDKRTILAFILIAIIFIFWQILWQPPAPPPEQQAADSTAVPVAATESRQLPQPVVHDAVIDSNTVVAMDMIPEQLIRVETDFYTATLSNKGGGLINLLLKYYTYADSGNVFLLGEENQQATPSLISKSNDFSDQDFVYLTEDNDLTLSGENNSGTVTFTAMLPSGSIITKEFTFFGDSHHFDLRVTIDGVESSGLVKEYVLAWLPGIPPTEENRADDYSNYRGGAYLSGDMYKYDSFDDNRLLEDHSGSAEWVGSRSKYFAYAIIPRETISSGAYVIGEKREIRQPDGSYEMRQISAGVVMPLAGHNDLDNRFTIYAGPLDYQILKKYDVNLEDFIDWGWKILQPFSLAVYWGVYAIHQVIPNYGIVVMLVAILLKVLTYPLTKKQLKSMRAMQALQPKIEEIKAKYKDNPQKMNQMVMKLYKQEKVNPFGSCLYMLPQMPFFIGLYQVFRSTFELRQAYFIFYWPDLSQPDPFPYVMPLIMCVAMFLQQKLTMTDPKHKMMIYLMPILFFFLFKGLPVGLVLYWTSFSVLSIFEALTIRRPQKVMNPQVK
ncbi:MAG: membrane protein insertase YidC [candidate division Zixibacteria bacterium]|nr:membrane protein insertase YidC [candidate division Zixibacteria bacterium]